MKFRHLFSLLLIFVFTFLSTGRILATFEDEYKNFLTASDTYRTAYAQYISTKSQYLQFGTLNSRNDALVAYKNFLMTRNNILLSYLAMLKTKNISPTYVSVIDEQSAFLQTTNNQIPALASLDDAVNASGEIEERHAPLQVLSRKVVGNIVLDRLNNLKLRLLILESESTTLINTLRSQNKDVGILDRWLLDAQNKRTLAEGKIAEAQGQVDRFSASITQVNERYNDIQFTFSEANQYLREGLSYLNELAQAIKYGNF